MTLILSHLFLGHDNAPVLWTTQDIVDTDDALFVVVLGVADQGGAGLHPRVAAPSAQQFVKGRISQKYLNGMSNENRGKDFRSLIVL